MKEIEETLNLRGIFTRTLTIGLFTFSIGMIIYEQIDPEIICLSEGTQDVFLILIA